MRISTGGPACNCLAKVGRQRVRKGRTLDHLQPASREAAVVGSRHYRSGGGHRAAHSVRKQQQHFGKCRHFPGQRPGAGGLRRRIGIAVGAAHRDAVGHERDAVLGACIHDHRADRESGRF